MRRRIDLRPFWRRAHAGNPASRQKPCAARDLPGGTTQAAIEQLQARGSKHGWPRPLPPLPAAASRSRPPTNRLRREPGAMSLVLVRHGQASAGTADYDRLSDLGKRQSRRLGDWLADTGHVFTGVVAGRMRRHRETLEGIDDAYRARGLALPDAQIDAGLDEFDHHAVFSGFARDHPSHEAVLGSQQGGLMALGKLIHASLSDCPPAASPMHRKPGAHLVNAFARQRHGWLREKRRTPRHHLRWRHLTPGPGNAGRQ